MDESEDELEEDEFEDEEEDDEEEEEEEEEEEDEEEEEEDEEYPVTLFTIHDDLDTAEYVDCDGALFCHFPYFSTKFEFKIWEECQHDTLYISGTRLFYYPIFRDLRFKTIHLASMDVIQLYSMLNNRSDLTVIVNSVTVTSHDVLFFKQFCNGVSNQSTIHIVFEVTLQLPLQEKRELINYIRSHFGVRQSEYHESLRLRFERVSSSRFILRNCQDRWDTSGYFQHSNVVYFPEADNKPLFNMTPFHDLGQYRSIYVLGSVSRLDHLDMQYLRWIATGRRLVISLKVGKYEELSSNPYNWNDLGAVTNVEDISFFGYDFPPGAWKYLAKHRAQRKEQKGALLKVMNRYNTTRGNVPLMNDNCVGVISGFI